MINLKDRIHYLSSSTKKTNKEIASYLGCSERSVRRYAGEWASRVKAKRLPQEMNEEDRKAFLLYDAHIPYHNRSSYEIALRYAQEFDPDDLVIGGDYADFKDVSFWKDDPRRLSFQEELEIVRHELKHLRSLFPTKRIIYIQGNHESRLSRYMWSKAPELCRLPELTVPYLLDLEPLGIEYVSNVDRLSHGEAPFRLGKLYILHGHEVPMSYSGVALARTMYLKTHVNVIFGHYHQSQQYIFKKLDNTHEGSWMVGCLCRLSEAYAPQNNWVGGFCTVKYNLSSGFFKVRNKLILENQVL